MVSYSVAQIGLQLIIVILLLPPEYWVMIGLCC